MGEKNPYRYRGYRYDNETGLYYLQSRYYNPEWGRFLNIDAIGGNIGALLSHNIYAYCTNNPINTSDPNGFRPIYTMGKETEGQRQASYRAMNKYYGMASSAKKPFSNTEAYKRGNCKKVTQSCTVGEVTGIYGPVALGGSGYATHSFGDPSLIEFKPYLGGSAALGAVWNGDSRWNIYDLGAHFTPLETGFALKKSFNIGSYNLINIDIQTGVALGGSIGATVGGYNDDNGIGVALGVELSLLFGGSTLVKISHDRYRGY